ncbi:MAG TPA: DUF1573 domain-containing protein [Flavobacteriales bacterium]|nr:DUF1573 domain-containing protein [Flavobacteriales bacterium]|tara:strand:- start:2177 stop:2701 length:525 start_codon:yes stop_codon:yes gene_type:complete
MNLNWKILFVLVIAALAISCSGDGNSDKAISRPASEEPSREIPVNTSPGAGDNFDPAKTNATAPIGPTTTVAFSEYEFDFGTLAQGDAVTHMFEFTNSGNEPLIIDNCKGSCGCTVPKCPKEPIQPGEKGQIEVKFNSKGKKNQQTKKVTINANTDPAQTLLTIKAFVESKPGN